MLNCAVPRANHTLRTVPPALCREYARAHDEAIWQSFCELFAPGATDVSEAALARAVATMPGASGGLGLRSAARTADAAYWASLVDVLPAFARKSNILMTLALRTLASDLRGTTICASVAESSRETLATAGATDLPSWQEAAQGAQAPQPTETMEPGFHRGWQRHACSVTENHFQR